LRIDVNKQFVIKVIEYFEPCAWPNSYFNVERMMLELYNRKTATDRSCHLTVKKTLAQLISPTVTNVSI